MDVSCSSLVPRPVLQGVAAEVLGRADGAKAAPSDDVCPVVGVEGHDGVRRGAGSTENGRREELRRVWVNGAEEPLRKRNQAK